MTVAVSRPVGRRRVVTVAEFAEIFGVDKQYVYRVCQAARLRTLPKSGRQHWKILDSEVDRCMREGLPVDPRGARR